MTPDRISKTSVRWEIPMPTLQTDSWNAKWFTWPFKKSAGNVHFSRLPITFFARSLLLLCARVLRIMPLPLSVFPFTSPPLIRCSTGEIKLLIATGCTVAWKCWHWSVYSKPFCFRKGRKIWKPAGSIGNIFNLPSSDSSWLLTFCFSSVNLLFFFFFTSSWIIALL